MQTGQDDKTARAEANATLRALRMQRNEVGQQRGHFLCLFFESSSL